MQFQESRTAIIVIYAIMSFSFQKRAEGAEHFGNVTIAAFHNFIKGLLRVVVPMPRILKRFDLRL